MKNAKKAFTLIELLVVIAVIGILAAMVYVGLNSVQAKARDTERKGDLRSLKGTIASTYNDAIPDVKEEETYAIEATAVAISEANLAWLPDYMKTIPEDPKDPNDAHPYMYMTDADGSNFAVFGLLENERDGDLKTTDPDAGARPEGYNYWLEND